MKKGYLTVYLSLTLAVILSLILTMVVGARISATRMKAVCAADIGINSVLSEYNRELLKQYDLLFVDMGYGLGGGGIGNVKAHLDNYLRMNLDESTPMLSRDLLGMRLDESYIEQYALATDNEAEAVRRQVSDYMETTLKGILTSGLDDLGGDLTTAGFDYDVEATRSEVQSQLDDVKPVVITNEEGEEEEVPLNNPADNVNSLRGAGILGICAPNIDSISKTKIDEANYLSHRQLASGNGISEEERKLGKEAGRLTYIEYLFDKCGYYSHEKEGSLLDYQIEYIVKGKNCDLDNLEKVCLTIVLWREAINYLYLLADADKKSEAELMASAVALVTYCPELKDPLTMSILLAWAYVESLQDMKILLEGGGVPVVKDNQTWHTGIDALFHPRSALGSFPEQGGPKYGDYLKTMLLMSSFSETVVRSLDIMEMDIRITPGNGGFRMDNCMHSFLTYITTTSTHGNKVEIRRRSGYYYA